MKKIMTISAILLLILSGCTKPDDMVTNDGKSMSGEVTSSGVEIKSNHENGFIEPGQTITFAVIEKFKDKKGNIAEKPLKESYTIEIKNKNVAKVNDDHSITIGENILSGKDLQVVIKYKDDSYDKKYIVRKSLDDTIDKKGVITDQVDYDSLVNKQRSLPSDYIPSDLVKLQVPTVISNPEINQLRKAAADALVKLFNDGKKEGVKLSARSGYRSYGTQKSLYNGIVASKGQGYADKYSAPPGKSEHQTGFSIDITCATVDYQLSPDFGKTPEGVWVKENAHKFGFIIRYPKGKEAIVGYSYEPWHLRYLGVELATKIFNSGLTMEEYYQQ